MLNKQQYGKNLDVWSTGYVFHRFFTSSLIRVVYCSVITYFVLGGYLPFRAQDPDERTRQVTAAQVVFEEEYWANITTQGKPSSSYV